MGYLDAAFAALPKTWTVRSVDDIAEIHNNKRLPIKGLERESMRGPYPYCGANGIVDFIDRFAYDGEYVLLAEDGGHWGRNEPSAYIMRGRFWVNNHAHVLRGRPNTLDNGFLVYVLTYMNIEPVIGGDARGKLTKSILTDLTLPYPPLDEQRQIAVVLSTVQQAIERQERLIALTAELKKALMHKLFTEGTRGEPMKQTEIGPMPQSWKVEPLGSLFSREPSNGLYRPQSDYGRGMLILRIDDFSNDSDIVTSASNRVDTVEADSDRFGLIKGDIVLNRVNSLSHLGKTALIGEIAEPMLFESNMMRFRVDEKRLRPAFAFRLLNSTVCKSQIISMAKRAVAQSSLNQGDVARLLLPLPPDVEIQDEILTILNALEAKSAIRVRMRASLTSLFRTLLHQLMTAQIRVHDLDLSALEEAVEEPAGAA